MASKAKIDSGHGDPGEPLYGCQVKLYKDVEAAAATAIKIWPNNRPHFAVGNLKKILTADVIEQIMKPAAIAVLTEKKWAPSGVKLGVAFMEETVSELQNKILSHMNAWNTQAGANVQFLLASKSTAEVRISRGNGGYWSYLGTDILHIPKSLQTMNLEGFVLKTPDSEYKRVIRHETGHTLGFPHEHMRSAIVQLLDVQKTITYFEQTQGWSEQEVRDQVLVPLSESQILGTPADVTSIMCYQLPGSITKTGQPIPGGNDIDQSDAKFAAGLYPKAPTPVDPGSGGGDGGSNPPPPSSGTGTFLIDIKNKKFSYPKDFTGTAVG